MASFVYIEREGVCDSYLQPCSWIPRRTNCRSRSSDDQMTGVAVVDPFLGMPLTTRSRDGEAPGYACYSLPRQHTTWSFTGMDMRDV